MGTKKKNKWHAKLQPYLVWTVAAVMLGIGLWLGSTLQRHNALSNNRNSVIINTPDAKAPTGLVGFLKNQTYCNGTKSVGLWDIYQTSQNKFAKVAYGCGLTLDTYAMAVKYQGKWLLLMPKQYLLAAHSGKSISGYGPSCELIAKYGISKTIEPVCVNNKGESKVVTSP